MNLRLAANRLTSRINANLAVQVQRSTGYTTGASGARTPTYAAPVGATVQVQALSAKEIEHLDALNISNSTAALYANMQVAGIDRAAGTGGDLVTFGGDNATPDELRGTTWLVTAVLEGWAGAGWCKAAITRQMP